MAVTVDRNGAHHDGANGRFISKGATGGQAARAPQGKAAGPPALPKGKGQGPPRTAREVGAWVRTKTTDQIIRAWIDLSAGENFRGRRGAVAALDAELARREGIERLEVIDDDSSREIDRLIGKGYSYDQAYERMRGGDPAAQQRAAFLDAQKLPGERRAQTLRRLYTEHVYVQWLQAEEATRGNLLSKAGRAKGIDPVTLWSGQSARAAKYASDELKAWWEEHGGRPTFTEFTAQYVGGAKARRAAQASRQAGAGRDYGV